MHFEMPLLAMTSVMIIVIDTSTNQFRYLSKLVLAISITIFIYKVVISQAKSVYCTLVYDNFKDV